MVVICMLCKWIYVESAVNFQQSSTEAVPMSTGSMKLPHAIALMLILTRGTEMHPSKWTARSVG